MPLSRLLEGLDGIIRVMTPDGTGDCAGPAGGFSRDPAVTALAFHSAQVMPGALFVAIRGSHRDGHDFVDEALLRGAHAVVVDRPEVARRLSCGPRPCVAVEVRDSRLALARLATRWFGEPSRELAVVGVTGTVGKTSTALFLRQLLEACGRTTGAIGSLGVFLGSVRVPSRLTTPDPLTLQGWLRAMADERLWAAIVEVSSHALLQHRASGVRLRAGALTDLVPHEHTDTHPTFADYLAAKRRFLELLADDAPLVYSAASPATVQLAQRWPAPQRVRYGLTAEVLERAGPADADPPGEEAGWVYGRVLGADLGGTWLEVRAVARARPQGSTGVPGRDGGRAQAGPGRVRFGPVRVRLGLLGLHSAANAVGAVAAAFALGLEWDPLMAAVERLRPLRRRMEVIYRGPFTAIDDTTGHPASFERLFEVLEAAGSGPLVLVVGVRGSRGSDANARNGRVIARWSRRLAVRKVVVTSSEEAAGPADRVLPQEREALITCLRGGPAPVLHCPTLQEALQAALDSTRPGDVLVLAGAQGLDRAASVFRRLMGLDAHPEPDPFPTAG